MNKQEELFKKVRENHDTLAKCKEHNFVELEEGEIETSGIPYKPKKMGKRYKCLNCSGQLGSINVSWYNLGRKHAMK